ncbi:MAG TPA: heparinase II/III family protein [Planctomycetota bacterium]|nr:heparinase II/III family protein [Planctomycetota bacterium]
MRVAGGVRAASCILFLTALPALASDASVSAELTTRLAEQIAEGLKGGEKFKVWAEVLGKKSEVGLASADAKSFSVLVQGNPFPLQWDKVKPEDVLGIAKSVAANKAERLLLAAEIAIACNQREQATDLISQARQADPNATEKINALASKIPDAAPPPAPKPVDTSALTGEGPAPAAAASKNNGMSLIAVPKKTGQPRKERPRLLFDAARVATVKARAASPDGKAFLNYLKNNPNDCSSRSYALAYVMTGDPQFANWAIERAQKVVSGGPANNVDDYDAYGEAVIVYDWCYSQLTETQRKDWQAWMLKGFDNTKDMYMEGYHNYGIRGCWAFALAGYALQGENSRSAELLDNAYNKRWRALILPAMKAGLAGGAWAEGEGYGATCGMAPVEIAELARCVEGKDLFSEAPEFFAGRLLFYMFVDLPGVENKGRRLWLNGDMNRRRNWDDALQQRLILQEVLRGTEVAAFGQAYSELPAAPTRQYYSSHWVDVMWRDRTAPQKPLEQFKLSHHAWGRCIVLMRSDWSETATHVGFVAGPFIAASHGHSDQGHFSIWKGGELVTQAGDYRGTGNRWALDAYKRTIAHNTLLIYDPSEKFKVRHQDAMNDGGQFWTDSESNMTGARIVAYDARRAYTYICADLTPAYSKNKAAAVRRQLLYLRPDTVIVHDKVVSTNPDFKKQWQCYLAGNAASSGKIFRTDNGKAKLKGEVLLPLDAQLTLQTGQDKAINVWGAKVAQPAGGSGDDGPAFRIDVHPGAARNADTFLVVMRVHEAGDPPATTIKDKGGQISISIPGLPEVLLSTEAAPGGSIGGHAFATTVLQAEE